MQKLFTQFACYVIVKHLRRHLKRCYRNVFMHTYPCTYMYTQIIQTHTNKHTYTNTMHACTCIGLHTQRYIPAYTQNACIYKHINICLHIWLHSCTHNTHITSIHANLNKNIDVENVDPNSPRIKKR